MYKRIAQEIDMPSPKIAEGGRLVLRVHASDMATLMRAVAIESTNMTQFVLRYALDGARQVIEKSEQFNLSERDSARAQTT
jgi:uncharacterized protein (DUF1778 family)